MDINLADLSAIVRSWGRGVVLRGTSWTPGVGTPLALAHLGDTEGDLTVTPNGEIALLTLPELSGPAGHQADYTGENPVIEVPLYLTSPAMEAIVSPGGSRHAGRSIRVAAEEHVIVLMPEGLFVGMDADNNPARLELEHAGSGVWHLDGDALTAAQEALLDESMWFWRCCFNRPPIHFKGGPGNDSKNLETVSIQSLHHPDMPEGHKLYTRGDPWDSDIDIEGGS